MPTDCSSRTFRCLLALVLAVLVTISTKIMASSVISPTLVAQLKNGGKTTAIIKMTKETQELLDKVAAQEFATRDERATAVTSGLQALADESQKELKAFLDSQSVAYESMWISNMLVVKEADLDLLRKLESIGGIKEIREEQTAHIMGGGIGVQ